MTSLENAIRLKELLGLNVYMEKFPCRCLNCCGGDAMPPCIRRSKDDEPEEPEGYFGCFAYIPECLPALSQLLEEVEKRGYEGWELWKTGAGDYGCNLREDTQQQGRWFAGYTPEDAVALALIAVLEGK